MCMSVCDLSFICSLYGSQGGLEFLWSQYGGFSLTLQRLCSVWCLFGLWVGTVQADLALNPFQGSSSAQWKNDGVAVRTSGESGHFGTNKWRNRHGLSHLWFGSARLKLSAQSQCCPVVREAMGFLRKPGYPCPGHGKGGTWTSHFTLLLPFHSPLAQELIAAGSVVHGTHS